MSRLKAYLSLGRVSNLPTVWTNVLAGIALGGGVLSPAIVTGLGVSASSAYVGGMFLNDAFDREIDARERPERPIPSGVVSAVEVFSIGFGLLGAAVVGVALSARRFAPESLPSAVLAAVGLVACIVLYDAWHKQNPLSPLVMGLCRGAVYVSAAVASGGSLTLPLVAGALAMVAYVFGLTAIARHENRRSFSGVWPLVLLAAPLFVIALAPVLDVVAWASVVAFVGWTGRAVWPLYRGGDVDVPRAVVALIAGISLLDGMIGAAHGTETFAIGGVAGLTATLFLQRWVRGT